ncbi:MAG: tRNA dihydrouridine synthase DusB [Clostridia bacterium]|nr:tRNA dihydrouridine synthase DusB [Clostridia bacterium]
MFSFESLRGRAVLAPMAGVGDSAFRTVCAESGAACTVTEMVSAKALHYGDKSTAALMFIRDAERPCGIQLFGSEPEIIAEGVKRAAEYAPDFIDLNMGCPVPKVTGGGDGSALLRNPALAGRIMEAAVKASPLPVSVKIRTGWDDEHVVAPEYVRMARECGVAAVAVHGRTRAGGYSAPVDFETIAACAAEDGVFVIGNGGVNSAADCAEMFARTGCAVVMVARGALGNPLIFREIAGGAPASDAERLELFLRQTRLAVEQKGEFLALRQARTHAGWYLRGMRGAAELRRRGGLVETYSELESVVSDALSQL